MPDIVHTWRLTCAVDGICRSKLVLLEKCPNFRRVIDELAVELQHCDRDSLPPTFSLKTVPNLKKKIGNGRLANFKQMGRWEMRRFFADSAKIPYLISMQLLDLSPLQSDVLNKILATVD